MNMGMEETGMTNESPTDSPESTPGGALPTGADDSQAQAAQDVRCEEAVAEECQTPQETAAEAGAQDAAEQPQEQTNGDDSQAQAVQESCGEEAAAEECQTPQETVAEAGAQDAAEQPQEQTDGETECSDAAEDQPISAENLKAIIEEAMAGCFRTETGRVIESIKGEIGHHYDDLVANKNAVLVRKVVEAFADCIQQVDTYCAKRERQLNENAPESEEAKKILEDSVKDLKNVMRKMELKLESCGITTGSAEVGEEITDEKIESACFVTVNERCDDESQWKKVYQLKSKYYYMYDGKPIKPQKVVIYNETD